MNVICFGRVHTLPYPRQVFLYAAPATFPSQTHVLFFKPTSLLSVASVCLNVGPSTGTWEAYQGPHVKKTTLLPMSPSVASCSSDRGRVPP